jgi:hypothetical protein
VCPNRRIKRHTGFADLAARGQCSLGWFYGFKRHWGVNQYGEVLAFTLTAGHVDDRNDQLKNQSQIEHSRHRSPVNFIVNLLAGLVAYRWQPKKPAIRWSACAAKALVLVS